MNATTISLIAMYALATVIMVICIIKDMHRSIFRGCVSLGLALIAFPLTMMLTHYSLDQITSGLLRTVDLGRLLPLTETFPSLKDGLVALVHMVAATEICRLVFFVLIAVLGLVSHYICRFVENKKPVLKKRSKPIGAAIGVVFGLVMIVAVFTPTAGYAAEAPGVIHFLGEVEQVSKEGEEAMSAEALAMQENADHVSDTALFKMVRALGGKAIFKATTTVEIDEEMTDLYTELRALDRLGADIAVLTAVPMDEYTDREYQTINSLGETIEGSLYLRTLGAEGLSALSQAWLKGESFLGFARPDMGDSMDFALDAVLVVMKDTDKDTIVSDVNGLAPAISAALRAFNTIQSVTAPTTPTTPDSSEDAPDGEQPEQPETVDELTQIVDAIVESVQSSESEETKQVIVRAGIGLVAKELEQFFVTSTTPADPPAQTPDSEGESGSESSGESGGEADQPAQTPVTPPATSIIPSFTPDALPEGTEITQETYEEFVGDLTDLAVSGGLSEEEDVVIESVKDIRDKVGIEISDEVCEQLVTSVLNSPYADLFDMFAK